MGWEWEWGWSKLVGPLVFPTSRSDAYTPAKPTILGSAAADARGIASRAVAGSRHLSLSVVPPLAVARAPLSPGGVVIFATVREAGGGGGDGGVGRGASSTLAVNGTSTRGSPNRCVDRSGGGGRCSRGRGASLRR